ncbi:MAG: response regulator [Anaerolineae bacterium]|nr:response regulator [Anaerolineae bacterium]
MAYEILIIENNDEDICFLDKVLASAGYKIRVARDGNQGLRSALDAPPDLILLDVMLPDIDGFAICKEIRAYQRLAMIPVIFMSADVAIDLRARAFEEGAFDYFAKPYNSKEILIRIDRQLECIALHKKNQENNRISERSHIASELHDSVNQTLFVIGIIAQSLVMEADKLSPDIMAELTKLHTLSQSALVEMKTLLNELRPSQIITTPMAKLINQLVDAYRLRIDAEISLLVDVLDVQEDIKLAFYRIIQEALNNIAKYADATSVIITFVNGGHLHLTIQDNGCGFDMNTVKQGKGLSTMKEHATQHNIMFHVDSHIGGGTRISASWRP